MLHSKVVVVTGGAGLIDKCFVRGIAEKGGIAIAADIDFEKAKIIASQYRSSNVGRVGSAGNYKSGIDPRADC